MSFYTLNLSTMAVEAYEMVPDRSAYTNGHRSFKQIAEDQLPKLCRWTRTPVRLVRFEKDESQYFGVRPLPTSPRIEQLPQQQWGRGDDFIIDFGIHMVGYASMKLESHGSPMDAPCRLRLTFGESPLDVTLGMDKVDTWISTSWLPDEVINVDMCPEEVRIPRRHAFRFLRVEVIDTSPKYKVSFSDVRCECVSAIGPDHPLEILPFQSNLLSKIDQIGIMTLRDCMQTVFEDGPRRDRRLWSGDLRLQALACYSTFKDYGLAKRCIFQFAAVARADGSLPACIFERPRLMASTDYILDYDALFASIVHDYVAASGDAAAGHQLWPTVLSCVKRAMACVNPETGAFESARGEDWKFLDWQENLDRSAGVHGVLLYCLKAANRLAELLGERRPFEDAVACMTVGAKLFLSKDNTFVSGPQSQVSYASAAWLVLAEVFPPEVARAALLATLAHPEAVRPLTPYLWHHVCDALATVGCFERCIQIMTEYWGGMVAAGADTFWECYDPRDSRASPYGDVRNNSFCHAWSCTPSYLLRGKLREFVIAGDAAAAAPTTRRTMTMGQLDQAWVDAQAVVKGVHHL